MSRAPGKESTANDERSSAPSKEIAADDERSASKESAEDKA